MEERHRSQVSQVQVQASAIDSLLGSGVGLRMRLGRSASLRPSRRPRNLSKEAYPREKVGRGVESATERVGRMGREPR